MGNTGKYLAHRTCRFFRKQAPLFLTLFLIAVILAFSTELEGFLSTLSGAVDCAESGNADAKSDLERNIAPQTSQIRHLLMEPCAVIVPISSLPSFDKAFHELALCGGEIHCISFIPSSSLQRAPPLNA